MPQLDLLILSSQSIFLVFFLFGYVFFTKNVIPMITFDVKMKELVEIAYIICLEKLVNKTITCDTFFLLAMKLVNAIYAFIIKLATNKYIVFGYTYGMDLIALRHGFRTKYNDRTY